MWAAKGRDLRSRSGIKETQLPKITAVSRDTLKKYHDSKNRHYTGAFSPNVSLVLGIIGNGIGEVGLLLSRLGD